MEKISVIVPVYDVEDYLEECIDSILEQTYRNLEIILVDDGSPDNCGQICDDYAKKDNRIKVIHKENGGLSDARNIGIKNSTGKYITFIDSDDSVNKKYIEVLYNQLIATNSDISICSYLRFKNYIDSNTSVEIEDSEVLTRQDILLRLYGSNRVNYVIACGKLYKIELFQNIQFPKGKINEDEYTAYRLYESSNMVSYNSSQLYYYRTRNDSIMNKKISEKRLEVLNSFDDQLNYYRKQKNIDIEIRCCKQYCLLLAYLFDKFKENKDYKTCIFIRNKIKALQKYAKDRDYKYIDEEIYFFIKSPLIHPKLLEPYWLMISVYKKIMKLSKKG